MILRIWFWIFFFLVFDMKSEKMMIGLELVEERRYVLILVFWFWFFPASDAEEDGRFGFGVEATKEGPFGFRNEDDMF